MSLLERENIALRDQVANLTRDCHYLISLLNSTENIDWDNWSQGAKIKEDLERSKMFFQNEQRKDNIRKAREELNRVGATPSNKHFEEEEEETFLEKIERERKQRWEKQHAKQNMKQEAQQKESYSGFETIGNSLNEIFKNMNNLFSWQCF